MTFASLRLAEPLLAALTVEGYSVPTPIQAQAIPPILAGKDLLGCAQTGTGKTAAFALPLLQRVMIDSPHRPAVEPHRKRPTRALILSPTRELASQIGQSIRAYGGQTGVRYAVIFGGVGQGQQVESLRSGIDVLVATPGRLLDLMNQGHVDLRHVEFFVLDEADRMLDMGFIHDIRKVIAKLPTKRQNLMFSATMPTEIRQLANTILHQPAYVEIAPVASTADLIDQSVYHVRKENKPTLLAHLYEDLPMARALVFTRTKHGADRLVRKLRGDNIFAEAIHGNKAQNARQRSLNNFKSGKIPMLVATDIAARGIDVDGVTHVINYDIPNEPETYIHRIGRTGRAGASGMAIAFCDDGDERSFLRDIEKLIKKKIDVRDDQPAYAQNHKLAPISREVDHREPREARPQKEAKQHRKGQGVRRIPADGDARPQHAATHAHTPAHAHADKPVHAAKPIHAGKPSHASHHAASHKPSHAPKPKHAPHAARKDSPRDASPRDPATHEHRPAHTHASSGVLRRVPSAQHDQHPRPHTPRPAGQSHGGHASRPSQPRNRQHPAPFGSRHHRAAGKSSHQSGGARR